MSGWVLRRAGPEDAEALALVGAATFLDAYAGHLPGPDIVAHCRTRHAPSLYAGWLAEGDHGLWLAEADGGAPVGFTVVAPPEFMPGAQADDLELKRIYSLGRFHGSGLGPAMMTAAIDWARARGARRMLVALWADNHRAMAFYRKTGFVVVGERPFTVGRQTYQDPVLALTL